MAVDEERRHEFKLQHCALKQPFVYRAKIILCILLGREEVVTCALQNGKGGYGERGGPRGVWEGGGEQAAARPWRAGRRRQRGSEGGPGTAARLGGRHARRRQRGSEGGTAAGRQRGSEGGTEAAARLGRREARRWQRWETSPIAQCTYDVIPRSTMRVIFFISRVTKNLAWVAAHTFGRQKAPLFSIASL